MTHSETYDGVEQTVYTMFLYNSTPHFGAALWVTDYNAPVSNSLELVGQRGIQLAHSQGVEAQAVNRTIDRHPGILIVSLSNPENTHIFTYWLDNQTSVSGLSLIPWDEGTLQLIKSIHVEKSKA